MFWMPAFAGMTKMPVFSGQKLNTPMQTDPKLSAMRLLARREHSRHELKQKLILRGFTQNIIKPLLDELEEDNLLSNDRFIGCYIRARIAKGMGPLKILAQLQNHEIDAHHIRQHDEWKNTSWEEVAYQVKIKRFGENIPHDSNDRKHQERFLQQRGFTFEQIRNALSTLVSD